MALIERNKLAPVGGNGTMTALTTSYAYFPWSERDDRTSIVVTATDACTITVESGDGIQGTADLSLSVPSAGTYVLRLESGLFKHTSGVNRGKVGIKASAASKASVGIACNW